MDLSQPVEYRGLHLNDVFQTLGVLRGVSIESVDYSPVEGVGYTEKRAMTDGVHASDVYLGPRFIELQGLIYASDLPDLFDRLRLLRVIFSPTSAYTDAPAEKGFTPIRYRQPTRDTQSFPGGVINLFINVRPRNLPRFTITRDKLVGLSSAKPQAIAWSASLLARDPRVYVSPQQSIPIVGPTGGPRALVAMNRGDYDSPVNIMLVTGGTAASAGTFRLQGLGVDMTIKIEAKANTIYRWRGDDRTLMTQNALLPNSAEALRMDLVTFVGKQQNPVVDADFNPKQRPYSTPFSYTCDVALATGSRIFWNEAYA